MEAPGPYFWRIIIFPASDIIWVPPFFYTTPIFSHHRRHVLPGRGLSRASLGRRGEGGLPGEAGSWVGSAPDKLVVGPGATSGKS